jgi:hypothetical protein
LVLRGEAGIGNTALLQYLIESARDLTGDRAGGVESEMEPAFASLHQTVRVRADARSAPDAVSTGRCRTP